MAQLTPASADPGDTLAGGCGYAGAGSNLVSPDVNQGVVYDVAVSREASGAPSSATVECWIEVNGVKQDSTDLSNSGSGVEAGQRAASFTTVDGDSVMLCTKVSFGDGSAGRMTCVPMTDVTLAPGPIIDALNSVTDVWVDQTVCPIFGSLGPLNVANAFLIERTGDIYLSRPLGGGYYAVYDCPPYGGSGDIATSSSLTIFSVIPSL